MSKMETILLGRICTRDGHSDSFSFNRICSDEYEPISAHFRINGHNQLVEIDSIAVSLFGNMIVETGEILIITKERDGCRGP